VPGGRGSLDDVTGDGQAADTLPAAVQRLRAHPVGIWTATLDALPPAAVVAAAQEIEALGYGSLWFGEAYGRESLTTAQLLLGATRQLVVGTGIATIYARGAMATGAAARLLEALAPSRFLLGLGVSHRPLVERDRGRRYEPPLAAMSAYLDDLAAATYYAADDSMPPVVLAALGPTMLRLARDRTAGAHSYLVTPQHTAAARAALGPAPLLVVEQAVVCSNDRREALRRAHEHLSVYTGLPNYRASWVRSGFDADDWVRGGSPRLADAMVVAGDAADIRARVDAHLAAGADHVCLQLLGPDPFTAPVEDWRALAAGLGLG
jgi:probable F420-dependent oxidoreductase